MPKTPRTLKVASDKSEIISQLPAACSDEATAVEFMERQRWGDSPARPRCGDLDVAQMKDAAGNRNKRFLWRCHGCKQQFTVRIGTIFEDSRIPMRHWCYGFWAACSSKKGVSALQIKRQTGLSYKSALFLMHRIRFAMQSDPAPEPKLTGIVEADETYVGGKPRYKTYERKPGRTQAKRGPAPDFKDRKPPVVAMVERSGRVRARVVANVSAASLASTLAEHVDQSARLITDERPQYRTIGRQFAGGHEQTANHSAGEYARGDVTTNTVEGFFSLLKRGIYGTLPLGEQAAPAPVRVGVRVPVQLPQAG